MSTQDPTPPPAPEGGQGSTPPGYSPPQYGAPASPGYGEPPQGQPPYGQPPYGQPSYGQPSYGQPGEPPSGYGAAPYAGDASGYGQGGGMRNGVGIAAFVVGLVSLLLGWLPFVGFLGVVAVILGFVGLGRVRKGMASNRGLSIAGIVLGALGILTGILWVIGIVFLARTAGPALQECLDPNLSPEAQQQCIEEALQQQQ